MRTFFLCAVSLILLTSCGKGYQVRVANYYLEKLDSVIIGNRAVIFTGVEAETRTEYRSITSGDHSVKCVMMNGDYFYGVAALPKGGEGSHTIQIDGLKQVTTLKD